MSRETCPRSGFVYVLTNPAMPGIVKIGRTNRSVEARAEELWTTGVPAPFEVYCEVKFPDCHLAEAVAHREFEEFRLSKSREFFSLNPGRILVFLEKELSRQIEEFVYEFTVSGQSDPDLDKGNLPSLVERYGRHRSRPRRGIPEIDEFEVWVASQKARVPEKVIWHFFTYFPWEDAGVREWIIDRYLRIRMTSQFRGENPYWFKDENGEYQHRPGPEETVQ